MAKKKGGKSREKKNKKGKVAAPEEPEVPIVRPNAFEIIKRKLQREKDARTAAWILYPDSPTYIKELGLDDPPVKKGKKAGTPVPKSTSIQRVTSEIRSRVASPVGDGDEAAKRKVILFNLNMKEYDVKPEEESYVEGEHFGNTDNEDENSVQKYVTTIGELRNYRELYVSP